MSVAINLQQVNLQFRHYAKPTEVLLEWLLRKPRHQVFHVLQDINLSLEQGGSLGVVGDNGAGKSTFLRVLAGNLPISSGICEIKGKRSALLELGSGLQPEATGIENIRLGLALRGLTAKQVEIYLPQVESFAELGDFIHRPLKQYSSGMMVRLGFAIATVIEPDILIIDEALSVGDQYFQKKSLDRMQAILHKGASLVFCSHNLYQVRELCQQAIWLEKGRIRMHGCAQQVVDAYQDAVRARQAHIKPSFQVTHQGQPSLLDVILLDGKVFTTQQRFSVQVTFDRAGYEAQNVHVGVVIRRNDEIQCYGISTLHDKVELDSSSQISQVRFVLDQLPLLSGEYCLEVWLIDETGLHVFDARERCCHFRVQQQDQTQGIGLSWMAHRWEVEAVT